MTDCFDYHAGESALLISIPHDGRAVPPTIAGRMTERALGLPDTDWHVAALYEFAKKLGASIIAAKMSRYVVDLNRSHADEALYDGRFVTGVCPDQSFNGEVIYISGESVGAEEKEERVAKYWRPYHDRIASTLKKIRERHSCALLWDAHSIPSTVPMLFDGELPELNFGTNDGRSCANGLIKSVVAEAKAGGEYSVVLNERFKGGYITRHYGSPDDGVHAIQLELAQRCYMSEASCEFDDELASALRELLSRVLGTYMAYGTSQ